MDAGSLDRKIQLLEPSETLSDWGESDATWAVGSPIAAQKQSLRMADHAAATALSMVAEAKFVIRWRDGITNKMRVRFEGTDFEIISIEEIGRKAGLVLLVRAG